MSDKVSRCPQSSREDDLLKEIARLREIHHHSTCACRFCRERVDEMLAEGWIR